MGFSAPAAGPFPPGPPNPARKQKGIPRVPSARVPPTQLGPGTSPGRRAPPGGANKTVALRQNTERRALSKLLGGYAEHRALISIAAKNGLRAARGAMRDARTTQCPLATGFPRSFGPKGKHSFHQAVTNYLSNDTLSCSDSGNAPNLLNVRLEVGAPQWEVPRVGTPAPEVQRMGHTASA
jgi:hypothetical protein